MTVTKVVDSLRLLAGCLFYLGVGGFVLGHLITFVPGAEEGYFIAMALLLVPGLWIPGWHRVVAILLLIACSFEIHQGHQNGLRYHPRLEDVRAKRIAP